MPTPIPAISLVIPTYNRADLIGETLHSAFAQTLRFEEIIVVDDGSTDDTQAVLAQYEGRITVIRTENNGVQAARNTGITAAKTDLVAVCDSDDLLEPDFCETLVPWLETHSEIDICFCNFITFDQSTTYSDKLSQAPSNFLVGATLSEDFFLVDIPDLYRRTLAFQPLFQSGLIMRKEFFRAIGGYDQRFKGVGAEDWEFTLRAIASGKTALCKSPLARVRRHPGNDSANAMRMNLGEAQILEFGLMHHPNAEKYRTHILETVDERRLRAFDAAFALGDFNLAKETLQQLRAPPSNPTFLIKRKIINMPSFLRQPLWKISQQVH